jgi:thiamine biosynthesis lipoprotein
MPYRAFLCVIVCLAACTRAPEELVLSGPTMGTTYTVKIVAAPKNVDGVAVRAAIDEVLARIDRGMSGYRPDSEIEKFNASRTTDWFEVSPEVAEVVRIALEVSEQSNGAFDVTVAPLVKAWGFGAGEAPATVPDDATLARLRERVGYDKLHVRRDTPSLRKDIPDLTVDLNGIAPGLAVDLLAERFRSMQIGDFMIDIGGEVRTHGRNARGERWRIAVERPIDTAQTPYAIVQLDDRAVTTSGEYRSYYVRDGHRYSHTIDPRTARPVEHDLASVVVIGATAAEADAWATAYNVLGAEAGLELATKRETPVMFIVSRGEQLENRTTPQFEKYLAPERLE